ncbi:MAG: ACT domain-containing protein [Verrucomicrobiota bacterium JB023]|nr:ACT domain-containing protein [Verrucomicrobiota bacterium JB023]
MNQTLVLTLLGPDRPGIVEAISQAISSHGGNWEESRMSNLAGHFAGLARVTCPIAQIDSLSDALRTLSDSSLSISLIKIDETEHGGNSAPTHDLDILGNDRPGIVASVARTLREHGANIVEIETELKPAPESGQMIFHTLAQVALSDEQSASELTHKLETLSPDLQVSFS